MRTIITKSGIDTEAVGAELAATLKVGDVILLTGDLGAGKTTLVRGIARALGIDRPIKSPTFTLLWEYQLPDKNIKLYHFDLYRLSPGDSTENIGLDEALAKRDGIVLIEWADRLTSPPKGIRIDLQQTTNGEHEISISN